MVRHDTLLATLEQWRSVVFLAAGGLFAVPVVASGLSAVTGTEIVVSPAAVFAFLLMVFVGLLGLYPRLAERDATLANGCVGLLAATTTVTVAGIWVFIPSTGYPVGETAALALVVSVATGATLTVAAFGATTLWTGAHSRLVGGFLLAMAASTALIAAAMVVYGHSTPEWVGPAVNGVIATSLGAIGVVLRTRDRPTEAPTAAEGVSAS